MRLVRSHGASVAHQKPLCTRAHHLCCELKAVWGGVARGWESTLRTWIMFSLRCMAAMAVAMVVGVCHSNSGMPGVR